MARILKLNGEIEKIEPENGRTFTLEELQKLVGGYIESVRLPYGSLIVNEEGFLRDLPTNHVASALAGRVLLGLAILIYDADGELE